MMNVLLSSTKNCFERGIFSIYISRKYVTPTSFEISNNHAETISERLNCGINTARILVKKNKRIVFMDDHQFEKTLELCKENFRLGEVIEFPILLSMCPNVLVSRLDILRHLGCPHVPAGCVVKFCHFVNETPQKLRYLGFLPRSEDFLSVILKEMDCPEEVTIQIVTKIHQLGLKTSSLFAMKTVANSHYLAWKLSMNVDEVEKLLNKNVLLAVQSVKNINSVITLLIEEFGFIIPEITKNISLLTLPYKHLEDILKTVPSVLDMSIQTLSKKQPRILNKLPSTIQELEQILIDFNVANQQLLCCTKVMNLAPSELQSRLQSLHNSDDFKVFKNHKAFLSLVCCFENLEDRLKILKKTGMLHSLNLFVVSNAKFQRYLSLSNGRTYTNDICEYLSNVFNCSSMELQRNLEQYPKMNRVSILNSHKVVEFLLSRGVSKKQLWNGLGIILYDIKTVEEYFNGLPNCKAFQPFSAWHGHYNLIQLLIYAIEKDVNFMDGRNNGSISSYMVEVKNKELDYETQCNYISESEHEELLLNVSDG